MPLPESFIQHLRDFGYHPRSNKHSNALATAIIEDLLQQCLPLADLARSGRVVYDLNNTLRFATATWNVDLVLGTPATIIDPRGAPILKATPATVQVAIEIKGVMTEHRKAVQDRKRDFEAHHEHVHNYHRRAIAGGVMVINAAPSFVSPLRVSRTEHGNRASVVRVVEHCITQMRNVTESGGSSQYGMDAKCAIVVRFDNENPETAAFEATPPAPQPGDPLHYDGFLQRLCAEYYDRFVR